MFESWIYPWILYIKKRSCLIFLNLSIWFSYPKQFSPRASGSVKIVFLRYLNSRIDHKNSNDNINTRDICSVSWRRLSNSLRTWAACSSALSNCKKKKYDTKKHCLMTAFKCWTNSVHIYRGSGNSTASNSRCLI